MVAWHRRSSLLTLTSIYTITLLLFLENISVLAVNSPQMIFYTPPAHDSYVYLESKYGYSATLNLRRPKPFISSPFKTTMNSTVSANTRAKISEFIVLGPEYPFYGVVAVIQSMNLRENSENNGCRDHIQFSVNGSESLKSNQICGYVEKNSDNNSSDPTPQRTFFSPDGRIHVYFYSDQSLDGPEITDEAELQRDIGVEIVFTSYTVCPSPINSWKKLKSCSKTEKMSCIYSTLFCDSKFDCGFPGEFGVDEEGCYISYIYMTVSIVGGILLTAILIFLFVRWVMKVPKQYR